MTGVLVRLVGVYDAEGTLRGELFLLPAGTSPAERTALCATSRMAASPRADWRELRSTLPVPFETFHRDDRATHRSRRRHW